MSRLKKPSRVVAMLQKEPSSVSRIPRERASPRLGDAAAARLQFAVRKITWESVRTNTIVTRFAVRRPIPEPDA